ncbi:MAG: hypothetical protein M1161_04360 [Candidatus Thermoplasmatota archaeon]|nr:hypothetical protein [Candidatus Thermoplasmatota archaeon]
METFDRGKYVIADVTRGRAMLIAFAIAAFLGFLTGLLPSGSSYIGIILLFVVLVAGVYLIHRAEHETKKNSDYLIAFFISLMSFLGFWVISLNIP